MIVSQKKRGNKSMFFFEASELVHPMIVSIVFGSYEVAGENGLADFGQV